MCIRDSPYCTGTSTVGSSEACMLGGIAALKRWQKRRKAKAIISIIFNCNFVMLYCVIIILFRHIRITCTLMDPFPHERTLFKNTDDVVGIYSAQIHYGSGSSGNRTGLYAGSAVCRAASATGEPVAASFLRGERYQYCSDFICCARWPSWAKKSTIRTRFASSMVIFKFFSLCLLYTSNPKDKQPFHRFRPLLCIPVPCD